MSRIKRATGAATFALGLALAPAAIAQQQGAMSAADMPTMMNQCAQMRQQMQQNPGAGHSADMQRMMAQCDQMDRMHGAQPSSGAAQAAPTQRR